MPTYDYRCEACKKTFEIFHSIRETKKKCPRCGASRLVQMIGPGAGFLFRGSGFYITDYRNSDYRSKAESEKPKPAASGSEKGASEPVSSEKSPEKGSKKGSKKGKGARKT